MVFLHLTLFAVAVSLVLYTDFRIIRTGITTRDLKVTHKSVIILLASLWISGLLLIYTDTKFSLETILLQPKLLLKLTCVCALTLNGFLIHRVAFKKLTRSSSLTLIEAAVLSIAGLFSTANWLAATYIGSANFLGEFSILTLLTWYFTFLLMTFTVAILFCPIVKERLNKQRQVRRANTCVLPGKLTTSSSTLETRRFNTLLNSTQSDRDMCNHRRY